MSAASPIVETGQLPSIYLACPLTGLSTKTRRQILSDIQVVKHAVDRITHDDRLEGEAWPVNVYAPIDHTAPWANSDIAPHDVYARNLHRVHTSDALVIVAEDGGSAGVGQELEWGVQLGIPILYLAAADNLSRQITGSPGFVEPRSYNGDAATLGDHVAHFLRHWKPLILDGPRRRGSRSMRFTAVATRLRSAWESTVDPTGVATRARVHIEYLELALSDPLYVAAMPTDTLLTIASALSVPLDNVALSPPTFLPIPQQRALFAAAQEDGWTDADVEWLLYEGRLAMLDRGPGALKTLDEWRQLHRSRSNGAE